MMIIAYYPFSGGEYDRCHSCSSVNPKFNKYMVERMDDLSLSKIKVCANYLWVKLKE